METETLDRKELDAGVRLMEEKKYPAAAQKFLNLFING